jgi:rubrerythrin
MNTAKANNFDAESAKDYEVYALEARDRDEPELAEFFENLAVVFQQHAQAPAKPKLTVRDRLLTFKEVISGE